MTEGSNRLVKNTIAMYFRTAIVTLVSLYIARVLLDTLGAENYGIYNVVGSIVVTFSFFNSTLQTAIQRFFNYALGENNQGEMTLIYSMSMIILACLICVVVLLSETVGLWFLREKLNVPPDRMQAAVWAFQFTIITFCIGVLRIPLDACVIAHEKLSFFAYLSLIEQGLRLGVVFLIKVSPIDKLVFYAALLSFVALINYAICIYYCRRSFDCTKFKLLWDKKLFHQLLSFSGWTILGSSTDLSTRQVFVFLLNMFYGVIANAAMGIANHVVSAVNSFVSGFQTSFRPQIVKSYAKGDIEYLFKLINSSSKISFLLMFLPGVFFIINMPYVLDLWLVDVPQYTVDFCRLMLVCCIIDALTGPYYATIMATGIISKYQIYISIVFCLDIVFTYGLFQCGVGAEYILYSRLLTRGFLCMFIGLYFLRKLISFSISDYFRNTIVPIFKYLLSFLPLIIVFSLFLSDGFIKLLITCLYTVLTGILLAYVILLNTSEKGILKAMFLTKIKTRRTNKL